MLDNQHQIAAYKLLQATPVHAANSLGLAAQTATSAGAKSTTLGALHVTSITYPTTVSAQVTMLTGWVALLTRVKTVCDTFKTDLVPYQDPEQMIQLYNGWLVYLKVNNLPETTPIKTNLAIADTTVVAALKADIDGLALTALSKAWNTVNTVLSTPPASGGTGSTTTPTLSPAQVTALETEMNTAKPAFDALKIKTDAVQTLMNNAKSDASHANDAFGRAVTVAILTNIAGNEVLTDSLKAIIPANVYAELILV